MTVRHKKITLNYVRMEWRWRNILMHELLRIYCKCTYIASFFVLIALVVPCEALHSWMGGGLDMRSECCNNLCAYAPRLLTALTVAFHTIFATKSSILISTRSSVMIVPTSQSEYVCFAGPEHPDPGECWRWEGGRRSWDNTLPWKSS